MKYKRLNNSVRKIMDEEFQQDKEKNHLYSSPRLNKVGYSAYPRLLENAISSGTDESLAGDIRNFNLLKKKEKRMSPLGGVREYDLPPDAPDNLAKGEFQRYYIRALCRKAIDDGIMKLKIISEKPVDVLPDDVKAKVGRSVDPKDLLDDLRENDYIHSRFGIPSPKSDLTLDY